MKIFKISQNPIRSKVIWGLIIGGIAAFVGFKLYVWIFISSENSLEAFFRSLEEEGYTANRRLSGLYYPGNVIQIMEKGPNGSEHSLNPPIVFLWHTDCFPNQSPKEIPYSLPQMQAGKSKASIYLKSNLLAKLFPMFQLDSNVVANTTLIIQNQRIRAYSKGDLNKRFSEKCKQKLYEAIYKEGDKEPWIKVILEAVVADSLILEVQWKTATSAKTRLAVTEDAKKGLNNITRDFTPRAEASDVMVALKSENDKKTVISAKGLLILGYRVRPIEVRLIDN